MSKLTVTGNVVFNHVTIPDNFEGTKLEGTAESKYSLTLALDEKSIKDATKAGLELGTTKTNIKIPKGQTQLTATRKFSFGPPIIYDEDKKETTVNHLSLFGDLVVAVMDLGHGDHAGKAYLNRLRVEEKASGGDYDPAEF